MENSNDLYVRYSNLLRRSQIDICDAHTTVVGVNKIQICHILKLIYEHCLLSALLRRQFIRLFCEQY